MLEEMLSSGLHHDMVAPTFWKVSTFLPQMRLGCLLPAVVHMNNEVALQSHVYGEYRRGISKQPWGDPMVQGLEVMWPTLTVSSVGGYRHCTDMMTSQHLSCCCLKLWKLAL